MTAWQLTVVLAVEFVVVFWVGYWRGYYIAIRSRGYEVQEAWDSEKRRERN